MDGRNNNSTASAEGTAIAFNSLCVRSNAIIEDRYSEILKDGDKQIHGQADRQTGQSKHA